MGYKTNNNTDIDFYFSLACVFFVSSTFLPLRDLEAKYLYKLTKLSKKINILFTVLTFSSALAALSIMPLAFM